MTIDEDFTYVQLKIGHLIKRQRELQLMMNDPDNICIYYTLIAESMNINAKLIEFYDEYLKEKL